MTLEQVIASCEKSAERYHKAFLRNKAHGGEFYQSEAESNRICAEHERQLAAWLRELQERRKAPEIIKCEKCKHFEIIDYEDFVCNNPESKVYATDFEFGCILGERRTNADD